MMKSNLLRNGLLMGPFMAVFICACSDDPPRFGASSDDGGTMNEPTSSDTANAGVTDGSDPAGPDAAGAATLRSPPGSTGMTPADTVLPGSPADAAATEPATCGDGVVQAEEECDDGTDNDDSVPGACRRNCARAACGDGVVDLVLGEVCDDGATNSDTQPDACRTDCTPANCGDGVIDPAVGETCDEGGANSDTAASACRTDCTTARCGDGVTDLNEACDEGLDNSDTTPGGCSTGCRRASCGNDVVDPEEVCDDGAGNSDTLPNTCRTTCRRPACGDGVRDEQEACDEGTANSDTQPDACRTDCSLARCGDGVTDPSLAEECDGQADCTSDCMRVVMTDSGGGTDSDGTDSDGTDSDDGTDSEDPNPPATVDPPVDGDPDVTTPEPCPAGEIRCGDDQTCIDPHTHTQFCGASGSCGGAAAGSTCANDETCVDGECKEPCPTDASPNRECSAECPCGARQGTCTDDAECEQGLVCSAAAGAKFGLSGSRCIPASCDNDKRDAGETSVDCGGTCGCRASIEFVALNGLPDDADGAWIEGMSGDGQVLVGNVVRSRSNYPAVFDASGAAFELENWDTMGVVFAASEDGSTVAGATYCADPPSCTSVTARPARWVNRGEPEMLHDAGTARAVSESGAVIAGETYLSTGAAFFRFSGSPGGGNDSLDWVEDMSGDGSTIVGRDADTGNGGIWVQNSGLVSLTAPSSWSAWSFSAVNRNGTVAVGTARTTNPDRSSMLIWRSTSGLSTLPVLSGAEYHNAGDVSADGALVVGSSQTGVLSQAILWDQAGGTRTVLAELAARGVELPSDISLNSADFVSSNGKIIVGRQSFDGDTGFWRVVLE